jgi:outer membrane protein
MSSLKTSAIALAIVAVSSANVNATELPDQAGPSADAWQFTVGLGAATQPRYPGSAERKSSGFPVLSATYGRYFIGGVPGAGVPAGIGAYLVQNDHWRVGVGLGGSFEKPRKETDSPRLRGLGDIDRTALGAVFASYSDAWWTLRGNVLTDIGGKQQGTRLSLSAEARYPISDTITLSAGPNVTWADAKYTQTVFGVDAAQSARSGLAVRHRQGRPELGGLLGRRECAAVIELGRRRVRKHEQVARRCGRQPGDREGLAEPGGSVRGLHLLTSQDQ